MREGPSNQKEQLELHCGYFDTNLLADIRPALMLSMVAFMMSELCSSPAALGLTMGLAGLGFISDTVFCV